MDKVWLVSALARAGAHCVGHLDVGGISVALIEITVEAVAGNAVGPTLAPWVSYFAGFGAILLTFLITHEPQPI